MENDPKYKDREISSSSEVSLILHDMTAGDSEAAERLLELVYGELKQLAQSKLNNERRDHTLQATELVHEAYLKLTGPSGEVLRFKDRRHFYATASRAMQRILTDHARKRNAQRRGGDPLRVTLGDVRDPLCADPAVLIDLSDALERLARDDPKEAELAILRLFGGLTVPELAETLETSTATVKRRWSYVQARLSRDLKGGDSKK